MSVRYLPGLDPERWYVITINEAEEAGQPWWRYYRAWLHGPNSQASVEWNVVGRHHFGVGFQIGRNGDESDLGLNLYGGRLFSLWLRFRTPYTKWARISQEADPKGWYHARHTSFRLFPHKGCYLHVEWDRLNAVDHHCLAS